MPIADDRCCYCAEEGFARISLGIEILGGKTPPAWFPPDTQRKETVCIECLRKSIDMGDEVNKSVEDLVDRLTPKTVPELRLLGPPEGTD